MNIDLFQDSSLGFFLDDQILPDASDLIDESNFIPNTHDEVDISSCFHENFFLFSFPMRQQEVIESKRSQPKRFKKEQKKILDEWFEAHKERPFLNEENILELSSQTGLTKKQILIYFTNKRARTKQA
jgi:hypothetical protein